ncbi:potassium-transporting ATPase subunit C [Streptomyces sp. SP17KL33]|uniref:potassium-transporting ATPase subunit C n=1 Tax=Streptomyces sp. SP17KL33 TaxID=3002534 RepID=UPI003FCDF408
MVGRTPEYLGKKIGTREIKLAACYILITPALVKDLIDWVKAAKAAVFQDNSVPGYTVEPSEVPADAVTSSGSGLDPDISPAYADLQVHRVAEKNGLPVDQVQKLVDDRTQSRTLGFIGEPRVNVLELNIALKDLLARS